MTLRTISAILSVALLTFAGCEENDASSTEQGTAADYESVEQTLRAYESALNASNVSAVIGVYTEDGVFMPEDSEPIVGRDAVREAYSGLFATLDLDLRFEIDEIEVFGDTAWARTHSAGTIRLVANDATVNGTNKEVFILKRQGEGFRIARYIFSSTQPAAN